MPHKRRSRRKTSSRAQSASHRASSQYHDLNVPIVLDSGIRHADFEGKKRRKRKRGQGSIEDQLSLIHRLEQAGYTKIALSHTVDGDKFHSENDQSMNTIPSLQQLINVVNKKNKVLITTKKGETSQEQTEEERTTKKISPSLVPKRIFKCEIIRRLNVNVSEPSELAMYSNDASNVSTTKKALKSYDLIAMSPKSDEAFTSICNMANLFYIDIITLDYTLGRGGIQLPYRLKSSDIHAAVNRGLVFEIPYGPALVDTSKRKAFVQTARLFTNACLGVKDDGLGARPKVILSSGGRIYEKKDHGSIVLRAPGDLINFAQIVLGFDDVRSCDALTKNAAFAVSRGHHRCVGTVASSAAQQVHFEVLDDLPLSKKNIDEDKEDVDGNDASKGHVVACCDESESGHDIVAKNSKDGFDPEEDFLMF